jgi:hypothetical protein
LNRNDASVTTTDIGQVKPTRVVGGTAKDAQDHGGGGG